MLRPVLIMLASTAAKQSLHLFKVCKAKAENSEEDTALGVAPYLYYNSL